MTRADSPQRDGRPEGPYNPNPRAVMVNTVGRDAIDEMNEWYARRDAAPKPAFSTELLEQSIALEKAKRGGPC